MYSIWVCPEPTKKKQNSITKYKMVPEPIEGNVVEKEEDYDLLDVVVISVNKDGTESENRLLKLLSTLFTAGKTKEQRKDILETEFGIPMTVKLGQEVERMCNLSEAILNEGKILGTVETMRDDGKSEQEIISRLMEKFHLTEDEARDYIKVPA